MFNVVCLFIQNNLKLRTCYAYFQGKKKKKKSSFSDYQTFPFPLLDLFAIKH